MSSRLQPFNEELVQVFRKGRDRADCHQRAGKILTAMAADRRVLHDIVSENLRRPEFLRRGRDNPVISMKICENHNFSLIAHLWVPLDDRSAGISHQSVHHHGKLLLTSASAWGPGYESVLFRSNPVVLNEAGLTQMEIDRVYRNPQGHLEFIGPRTPHVVFFPQEFTVTYALWSPEHEQAAAGLKSLPGMKFYKKWLKRGLSTLGLASPLGLNVVEFLDYYPRQGQLIQLKQRVRYPMGTNENFLQNLFFCLQQMEFERFGEVTQQLSGLEGATREKIAPWRTLLEAGKPISTRMEPSHWGIERVQFTKKALLECFPPPSQALEQRTAVL